MGKLTRCFIAAGSIAAAGTMVFAAGEDLSGTWPAASTTAISITGDITVTTAAVQFENGQRLPWVFEGIETAAWGPTGAQIEGAIYRIPEPSDPTLIQGNTLCGLPVTYIVLSPDATDALIMNVFRGAARPADADDGLCAMYYYAR